jgi:hypothetical protein
MRRIAASALRALRPVLDRPMAAEPAARAFACRTKFDAPPPKMVRRPPGGYLSGVAHSALWRPGHRYKASTLPSPTPGAPLTRSRQVLVEYDPKDVDHFIALADALEARGAVRGASRAAHPA